MKNINKEISDKYKSKYESWKILFLSLFCFLTYFASAQKVNNAFEAKVKNPSADSAYVDSLVRFAWRNKYSKMKESYMDAELAFKIARQINYQKGILKSSNYLGQQLKDWTNYSKALSYYYAGLKSAKKIENSPSILRFYLLIGQLYDIKKQYPEALKWYNTVEKEAMESGDSLYMAYAIGDKAIIMDKTGHLDSAYLFNQMALKYLSNGVGNKKDLANYYNNLALNQKRQHHYKNALIFIMATKRLLQNTTDTFALQLWYNNAGSLYTAMGKLDQAKSKFDTAIILGKIVKSNYINEDLYKNISHYYEAKRNYAAALNWLKKSNKLADTIQQEKQARQFAALQVQHEVGKKETRLTIQSHELQQRKRLNIATLAGLSLLLILTGLLLISNRKRRKFNRLLTEKNEEISLQQEKLRQANHVKDRLFSIISHDLKSPMESLRYYLKMLTNNKLDKREVNDLAAELEHHFHHTRYMTDNLLYWASRQMKGWQLTQKKLYLSDVLNEVLGIIVPDAKRKGICLSNHLSNEIVVSCDPDMLKLVLRNILSNAIKFTPEGGNIDIAGKNENNKIRISISDNGTGITAEMIDQFKQGIPLPSLPGTLKETGTGLGILISRQFLEKQGGRMDIESRSNGGTTVHIDLPANKEL